MRGSLVQPGKDLLEAGTTQEAAQGSGPRSAYLSLLFGRRLDGRFCSSRWRWRRAAHALVAAVTVVLVGAPGARRLQLRVKLAVGRRGRGGQHQSLERRHFCL